MKSEKNKFFLTHASLVALIGAFYLSELSRLLLVFFESAEINVVLLFGISILTFVIGQRFFKPAKSISVVITSIFLVAFPIIHLFYNRLLDFPGYLEIIIYMNGILCGMAFSLALNTNENKTPILLLALTFILGIVLSQFQIDPRIIMLVAMVDLSILLFILNADSKRLNITSASFSVLVFGVLLYFYQPINALEGQNRYHDRVVFSFETQFQKVEVTSWKGNQWFYFNGINQFSTVDEWLYYEPFVHPAMHLQKKTENILIIGGENGILARELLTYDNVTIDVLPVDYELLEKAQEHYLFTQLNNHSLSQEDVEVVQDDLFKFLYSSKSKYDLIFIDIPDPVDLEMNQYFTLEFYNLCQIAMTEEGLLVTQAGSPYFAPEAFISINKTLEASGFSTLTLHNQVLSIGEWGWVIAAKNRTKQVLKSQYRSMQIDPKKYRWLNNDASKMLASFGKYSVRDEDIEVNTLKSPVVHDYYSEGHYTIQ